MQDLAQFKAEMVDDLVRLDRQIQATDKVTALAGALERDGFQVKAAFDDIRDAIVLTVHLDQDVVGRNVVISEDIAGAGDPIVIEPPDAVPLPAEPIVMPEPVPEAAIDEPKAAPVAMADPIPGAWTPNEDKWAIDLFAAMDRGLSFNARAKAVAEQIGRTPAATSVRLRTKLAGALAEALAAAMEETQVGTAAPAMGQAQVEPPVSDGGAVAADRSPASPIQAHVLGIKRSSGWSLSDDLEMMESVCDGLLVDVIADQLAISTAEVNRRRDVLTGLYKDGNGKSCRQFPNEKVRDALRQLVRVPA